MNDFINACFEFGAGFAVLNHCRCLWRDKEVKGISILSTAFFTAWGFWNIFYYPSLGQWWSFVGGLFIVAANCVWLGLLVWYGLIVAARNAAKASTHH